MKFLILVLSVAIFSMAQPSLAACGPPMCGDAPPESNDPFPSPRPIPSPKKVFTAVGYSEVASANCAEQDLKLARRQASTDAIHKAQDFFAARNLRQIGDIWFNEICEQSNDPGAVTGNFWMVEAFGKFSQ